MNKISVAGNTGFIGSRFCKLYPNQIIRMNRDQREPETNNILNFISTTNNYAFCDNILRDVNTNIVIMLEMLDKCKNKFGNDFIFNQVSTWSVYGNIELPAKENAICNPTGFYSISKRTAEQLLITFCQVYEIKYRIFRLCNVIGETDKIIPTKRNALQYLINELKENRDINLYNNGDFYREFMYVDDICEAINLCIYKSNVNEIYNIGSGIKHLYSDIIDYCKEYLQSKSKINKIDSPFIYGSVQAKDIYLDINKLNMLGFKPKYSIYDALDIVMNNEYLENNK